MSRLSTRKFALALSFLSLNNVHSWSPGHRPQRPIHPDGLAFVGPAICFSFLLLSVEPALAFEYIDDEPEVQQVRIRKKEIQNEKELELESVSVEKSEEEEMKPPPKVAELTPSERMVEQAKYDAGLLNKAQIKWLQSH